MGINTRMINIIRWVSSPVNENQGTNTYLLKTRQVSMFWVPASSNILVMRSMPTMSELTT